MIDSRSQALPVPVADAADLERRLEVVRDMLAGCVNVDDAREWADQAAAMQAYARRARLSREALNYAAEVKLRAERRVGELLPTMIQHGGDPSCRHVTLGQLGLQGKQSERWQAIARIPAAAFDDYLARYRQGRGELVSKALYDLARQYRPEPEPAEAERPSPPSLTIAPPLPGIVPYYADEAAGIYLYHGDARELVPHLLADVLITDPPYGVELGTSKTTTGLYKDGRAGYAGSGDTYAEFKATVPPVLEHALAVVRRGAVFTGPHIWDVPEAVALGGVYCPAAMGRHAWGFKTFLPVLFYGKDPVQEHGGGCLPIVLHSNATAERNGHPCPKPLEWMRWLVGRASWTGETILDPFAGSGTTLQAAKFLGRPAIGIEIEERYCAIAAQGLAQTVLPLDDTRAVGVGVRSLWAEEGA